MQSNQLFRCAGWSAYVNVGANIIGFVSLVVFFSVGGIAGPINDSSSIFFALSLIPLALMLHILHRSLFPPISLVVTTVGVIAMITTATLQALLVLNVVQFEQTLLPVLTANAVIGGWFITNGILAHVSNTLPKGLAWWSIIAGAGLVLIIFGFWIGGQEHPLTAIGGLASFIGILIWTIWLGRLLLAGKVTPPEKNKVRIFSAVSNKAFK